MSDDGRASGERAEWLQVEAMLARAPVEVFIDSYWPVAIVILVAGGVIGAVCVANVIPASFEPWAGWLLFWVGNRLAGFLIGLAAAFIILDVPLTLAALWLRRYRPHLFQRRR